MSDRKSKFANRVRFNWGYHDAASDAGREQPRTVVEQGEHNVKQVSVEFDEAYARGYVEGLADVKAGVYRGDSTAAWDRIIVVHPALNIKGEGAW